MDIEYELREIEVSPDQLLLDPNNPRLQHEAKPSVVLRPEDLNDNELQRRVGQALHDKEHAVKRLVDSIKENGFVNIDSIFVKSLPSVNKYLVLEGNRRTSAIKQILYQPGDAKATTLESLKKIPVKELICDDDVFAAQMTDFILSIRHIFGVKEWAPMQKAHSIHHAYKRRLSLDGIDKFRFIAPIANAVGKSMNLQPDEIRKALSVYRVYSQLQALDFEAKSDHYSLIEMCISRPSMAVDLFGFDKTGLELSHEGAELFDALCIESGCEVTNPAKFRQLYKTWKEGTGRDIRLVARGSLSIEDAARNAGKVASERDATKKLQAALDTLQKIEVGGLNGSSREKELAESIHDLVLKKILPALFK
jgi:hypothetical protein